MIRIVAVPARLARPLSCAVVALLVPLLATAAPYQRRWSTIDGGGLIVGRDSLSVYRIGASVGQPDASPMTGMTGGGYRIVGGFWCHAANVGYLDAPGVPEPQVLAFRALTPSPNPSRGTTTLAFDLPEPRAVVVRVCDVQGRLVRELDRAQRAAGHQRLAWDGRDGSGTRLPRGLYFVHIDAGRDRAVVKLVLLDPEGGAR